MKNQRSTARSFRASMHRLSFLGRKRAWLLAAPVVAGGMAGSVAKGEIVYHNLGAGLTVTEVDAGIFWEMDGVASYSSFAGADFRLFFQTPPANAEYATVGIFGGNAVADPGIYAEKFSGGATINGSLNFYYGSILPLQAGSAPSPWAGGANAYLALYAGGNYGWAHVNYINNTSLTLLGYAYENTGAAITAGAVPEPATTGIIGALVAGSAAAWAARQRRKKS